MNFLSTSVSSPGLGSPLTASVLLNPSGWREKPFSPLCLHRLNGCSPNTQYKDVCPSPQGSEGDQPILFTKNKSHVYNTATVIGNSVVQLKFTESGTRENR